MTKWFGIPVIFVEIPLLICFSNSFALLNKKNIYYGVCEYATTIFYKASTNTLVAQGLEEQQEKWNVEMKPAPLDLSCEGSKVTYVRRDSDSSFEFGWLDSNTGQNVGQVKQPSKKYFEIKIVDSSAAIGFQGKRILLMQFDRKNRSSQIISREIFPGDYKVEPISNISKIKDCFWGVVSAEKLGKVLAGFCLDSSNQFRHLPLPFNMENEKQRKHETALDDYCICGGYMYWARNDLPLQDFALFQYDIKELTTKKIRKFGRRISLIGCDNKIMIVTDWSKNYRFTISK